MGDVFYHIVSANEGVPNPLSTEAIGTVVQYSPGERRSGQYLLKVGTRKVVNRFCTDAYPMHTLWSAAFVYDNWH